MVLSLLLVLVLYMLESVSADEQKISSVFLQQKLENSNVCVHEADIEEEGVYKGSACFVTVHLTWDEALKFCREQDMVLFMVKTKFQFFSLLELAEKVYGHDDSTYIWVNAKRDINRNNYWIAYSRNKEYAMVEYYQLFGQMKKQKRLAIA